MQKLPPIDEHINVIVATHNNDSIGEQDTSKKPENKIKYLYELDDIDRQIIKYLSIYPEMTSTTLGQILNLNSQTVRNHRNKPCVKYAMQIQLQTTDEILEECAKKAGKRLLELIADPNPLIALAACKLALTKQMKTPAEVAEHASIVYRTTFAPDGSLVQDIVREELGLLPAKQINN